MINGELGYDDLPDVIKIRTHLTKLGITSSYKFYSKDKYGNQKANPTFADKSFTIGGPTQPVKDTKDVKDTNQPVVDSKKRREQLAARLKQTQKSLGVPNSGALDNATLQAIITKLSPRPQVQAFSPSITQTGFQSTTQLPQAGMTPEKIQAELQKLNQISNRPK
jgi:uncharacterized protein (DUF2132 family)